MALDLKTFENARILFKNFSGKEGKYNRKGDRNFSLALDEDRAVELGEEGWNVKYLSARDPEEKPQAIIQVAVRFGGRPPRVVLITSKGKTNLTEDEVSILDWADISNIDLVIRGYEWEVNGNSGIKAYLKSIFVTLDEDELDLKYADVPDAEVPDSARSAMFQDAEDDEIPF